MGVCWCGVNRAGCGACVCAVRPAGEAQSAKQQLYGRTTEGLVASPSAAATAGTLLAMRLQTSLASGTYIGLEQVSLYPSMHAVVLSCSSVQAAIVLHNLVVCLTDKAISCSPGS